MYPKEQLQEVGDLLAVVYAHLKAAQGHYALPGIDADLLALEKAGDLLNLIGTEDKKV